jgi:hypothetical protein
MPKRVAAPKVTGGGGFVFEDDTAAYFLACLLAGHPPLDPSLGFLTRLDFQTRADGWLLDDLLLTLTSRRITRRCALSVKSNQQFTSRSAPAEFVKAAWEQLLHEGTDVFDAELDHFGIVTSPLPVVLSHSIQRLVSLASREDSELLARRSTMEGFMAEDDRNLLSSLACPPDLAARHSEQRTQTGEFLKRLQHLEFDFEHQSSTRSREAVAKCRGALLSNSLDEAVDLWGELRMIAQAHRPKAGYLDLKSLADELRHKFQLKDFPEYQADWERLLRVTRDNLAIIRAKVGGIVSIPRNDDYAKLSAGFGARKAVVIRGPSGCGKTVLTKRCAEETLARSKVLWMDANTLETIDLISLEPRLGLSNRLRDVLRSTADGGPLLVIDGVDRLFSEQAFRNIAILLECIELGAANSPWRLIATVQPEEWDRVQIQLAALNVATSEWEVVDVAEPSAADLAPVWAAFPSLYQLTLRPHLSRLLLKPKVLDLLATRLHVGTLDTTKWVGESDLIKWFWQTEVLDKPDGATRAGFLKALAERQGDELRPEIPSGVFPPADQTPVSALVRDRICRTRDEKLSFDHDLYGDWARQRILLSNADAVRAYLSGRITSPLWQRALRLYSLHLLEQEPDLTVWRCLLNSFDSGGKAGTLEQDLILESAIFAADPETILERLWGDLSGQKGKLLRRLLRRFHHTATMANPLMLALSMFVADASETDAALINRVPYWPFWFPMLRFLHRHLTDVVAIGMLQAAELADTWLRQTPGGLPLRKEASEIALAAGESMNHFKRQDGIVIIEDRIDEKIYRAVLAGAGDLTERVTDFALEALCRRQRTTELDIESQTETVSPGVPRPLPGPFPHKRMTEPWPDGPMGPVNGAFRKACLDSDGLLPLINANANAAREVILAALIEEPQDYYDYHRQPQGFDLRGFELLPGWHPPFYLRGPFLQFLRAQPEQGLDTIFRLVDFATERWSEEHGASNPSVTGAAASARGPKDWVGDGNVYYWYRDFGTCTKSVVSALMALEKWLYEQIDQQKDIEPAIETILRGSCSVAFAGVLSAVARKDPSLLEGVLRPLLKIAEFHFWESEYTSQSESHLVQVPLMMGWAREGAVLTKAAEEWHNMPHRKRSLHDWAVWLFVSKPEIRASLEEARADWLARLNDESISDRLAQSLAWLVPKFDISNYTFVEDPQSGGHWRYNPPKELREKYQTEAAGTLEQLRLKGFPLQCKQMLDSGRPLSPEGIEQVRAEIHHLADLTPDDNSDETLSSVADAVTGGITVLIEFHGDWLDQNLDEKQWCTEYLIAAVRNPPPAREFDSERSMRSWSWDTFCARAIPVLWSKSSDSREIRECIVKLAMNDHYRTVAILCASAARYKPSLGRHFTQLLNFILLWSSARWENDRYPYPGQPKFDLDAWLLREARSFIDGKTNAQLSGFSRHWLQDEDSPRHRPLRDWHRGRRFPKVDLTIVQWAFSWLPNLAHAQNEEERSEWIAFWKEMLDVLIWTMGEEVEHETDMDGAPNDWDRWVLGRIASLVQQLDQSEHPENFWQPILNLGGVGHYWVEDFLTKWFSDALTVAPLPDNLFCQWRAMIDFSFSSPAWTATTWGRGWHAADLWCHLMGYGQTIRGLWGEQHRQTVDAMQPYYHRWATEVLHLHRCLTGFSVFLMNKAADGLLLEAVCWIEASLSKANADFFNERDVKECLAVLVDHCWQKHKDALRQRSDSFKAFTTVLRRLADFQNPTALEIQQKLMLSGQ